MICGFLRKCGKLVAKSSKRGYSKQILYGQEGRLRLLRGCNQVSDAVQVTLGPKGRFVIIDHILGNPQVTKDGYTVAKAINLEDRLENLGCSIAKSAAEKTNWEVGDGTTATMILTRGIFKEGCRALAGGSNPMKLREGILLGVNIILKELERMSIKLSKNSFDLLQKVSTIAANGDKNTGNLVAFTLQKVGINSYINVVHDKKLLETEIEFSNGYKFDNGMISPYFAESQNMQVIDFINPLVLISAYKISDINEISKFLDYAASKKRPLFILTKDIDQMALTYLLVNNTTEKCRTCVVKNEKDILSEIPEDIAALTSATAINEKFGLSLKNADINCLGEAKKIIIHKDKTIIIAHDSKIKSIGMEGHLKKLLNCKENAIKNQNKDSIEFYGSRISKLNGKSAIIHVGGATEAEISELKDRIDDSVHTTQAALQDGILVGGGAALIHASKSLESKIQESKNEIKTGLKIMHKICRLPCIAIAENSGLTGIFFKKKFRFNYC